MAQKLSPFLDSSYGWAYGESGWNVGMDENLLKFSFLFDRNIDGVVSSLPAVLNGSAYFLTTDNRIYFGVNNTWYSSPTPKWFILIKKATGELLQFNGSSLTSIANSSDLSSQISAIQVTLDSLGTAAFQPKEYFATQTALTASIATSAAYTDQLKTNLQSNSDGSKGAALVGFSGRTVKDRLLDTHSVKDFGVVGDGIADDTTAIQAANDFVESIGGGFLIFPSGSYKISATLRKKASGVTWLGSGRGEEHDVVGSRDSVSSFLWNGSAGGTMVDFSPTAGATNRRISGGGVVGFGLYGNGTAAIGISLKSVNDADIHIYGEDFSNTVLYGGVVTTLGEARDTQICRLNILAKQVSNTAGSIVVFDGDVGANFSKNDVFIRGLYKNGNAVDLINSDNNLITQWTFRFGGGTGKGILSHGGTSAQTSSRGNCWRRLYAGDGGVHIQGTSDGYAVASTRNLCLMWDNDNSQPEPVLGTGAAFTKLDLDGRLVWSDVALERTTTGQMNWYGPGGKKLVRMTFNGSGEAFWTYSHSATAVSLGCNSDTLTNVSLGISTKGTGQGDLYGNNFAVKPFSWSSVGVGFQGTNPIAKPTITGSRGGNAALASLLTQLANYGLITDSSTA